MSRFIFSNLISEYALEIILRDFSSSDQKMDFALMALGIMPGPTHVGVSICTHCHCVGESLLQMKPKMDADFCDFLVDQVMGSFTGFVASTEQIRVGYSIVRLPVCKQVWEQAKDFDFRSLEPIYIENDHSYTFERFWQTLDQCRGEIRQAAELNCHLMIWG